MNSRCLIAVGVGLGLSKRQYLSQRYQSIFHLLHLPEPSSEQFSTDLIETKIDALLGAADPHEIRDLLLLASSRGARYVSSQLRPRPGLRILLISPMCNDLPSAIPILWVHGTEDLSIPLRHAEMLSGSLPNVTLVQLPADHSLHCLTTIVAASESEETAPETEVEGMRSLAQFVEKAFRMELLESSDGHEIEAKNESSSSRRTCTRRKRGAGGSGRLGLLESIRNLRKKS